jgi:hypothetical protein
MKKRFTRLSCRIFSISVCEPLVRSKSSRSLFSSSSAADRSAWLLISLYLTKINHPNRVNYQSYLTKFRSMKFFHSNINFRFQFRYCITNNCGISNIGIIFWIIRCWGYCFCLWLINLLFLKKLFQT